MIIQNPMFWISTNWIVVSKLQSSPKYSTNLSQFFINFVSNDILISEQLRIMLIANQDSFALKMVASEIPELRSSV